MPRQSARLHRRTRPLIKPPTVHLFYQPKHGPRSVHKFDGVIEARWFAEQWAAKDSIVKVMFYPGNGDKTERLK